VVPVSTPQAQRSVASNGTFTEVMRRSTIFMGRAR
jgi:hypothetical protein